VSFSSDCRRGVLLTMVQPICALKRAKNGLGRRYDCREGAVEGVAKWVSTGQDMKVHGSENDTTQQTHEYLVQRKSMK
jgi:hypothetical protein